MNVLAVDTSTSMASLALIGRGRLLAEALLDTDRTLSARLMAEISRLLSLAGLGVQDVDLFAASTGPGSFTGVRAGVATIQGLALAAGRPCAGFSSLAALAMNFPCAAPPVCALLDARKGEVYAALYDCSGMLPLTVLPEAVLPPERLLEQVRAACPGTVIFCGDGAIRYHDLITAQYDTHDCIAPLTHQMGRAANGARLALDVYHRGEQFPPHRLLPVYLRPSDAEYAKLDRQKSQKSA